MLLSGLVLFLSILFAVYKGNQSEWQKYQAEYKKLLIRNAKDETVKQKARSISIEIQQIYLDKLNRVDRCTNCHMGVENPLMSDAKMPFKLHSGDFLKDHPSDRFGCTICHNGQGRATNLKEAHGAGRDTHWDYPILPLLRSNQNQAIPNLRWLIPMAINFSKGQEGNTPFEIKGYVQ